MTKAELIATVGKEAKISKASAEKVINAFTSAVTKALKKRDKLTLTGFGTFSAAKRGREKGEILKPERRLRFLPSMWQNLKQAIC